MPGHTKLDSNDSAFPEGKYPGGEAPLLPNPPPAYEMQELEMYGKVPPRQTIMHVTSNSPPPKDYFRLAFFVTLCCCVPLGVVGLIKSSEVRTRRAIGDEAGALKSSKEARRYSLIGLCVGIVLVSLIWITLIVEFLYVRSLFSAFNNQFKSIGMLSDQNNLVQPHI